MRDSFIMYRSFYEAITDLTKEQQADVWRAICEYSLNFQEIELDGIAKTIFKLIKPQLDANNKRYENGTKPKNKQEKSKTEAKQKQSESELEANNNVNVNENNNENDFVPQTVIENREFAKSFESKPKIKKEEATETLIQDLKVKEMFSRFFKLKEETDLKRVIDEWVFQADLKDTFPMDVTNARTYLKNWCSIRQSHEPAFFKPKSVHSDLTFEQKLRMGLVK